MSALLDRSQPVKFHFGNAAKDLHQELPEESPETSPAELLAVLDQIDAHIGHIQKSRTELAFLIADLKRILA